MAASFISSRCLANTTRATIIPQPAYSALYASFSRSASTSSKKPQQSAAATPSSSSNSVEILLEPKISSVQIKPGREPWVKRVSSHSRPYRPVLEPTPVSSSQALNQVKSQGNHYAIVQLYQRKYIVTPGDIISLPHIRGLSAGFQLELEQITEIGSRDYTIRGAPYLNPDQFLRIRGIVCEVSKGLIETKVKFKRRKRYQKVVQAQHTYTRIRVGDFEWSSQGSADASVSSTNMRNLSAAAQTLQ